MRCPECHSPNIDTARSCAFCGASLPAPAAAQSVPNIGPVRRPPGPIGVPGATPGAVCDCCGAPMAAGREMCEACERAFSSVLHAQAPHHAHEPATLPTDLPVRPEIVATVHESPDAAVTQTPAPPPEPWWKVQRQQSVPPRPQRVHVVSGTARTQPLGVSTAVAVVKRGEVKPVRAARPLRAIRVPRRLVRPAFVAAAVLTAAASVALPAGYRAGALLVPDLGRSAVEAFRDLVSAVQPADPSPIDAVGTPDAHLVAAPEAAVPPPSPVETKARTPSTRPTPRSRRAPKPTAAKPPPSPEPESAPEPATPLPVSPVADAVLLASAAPLATATRAAVVLAGPALEPTQVDVRPEILSRVAPRVPDHLRDRDVEDVVVLRVLVSADGQASDMRVLRASRLDASLDTAAMAAVSQWQFAPAQKGGRAVSCWFSVGVPIRSTN